jgi:hypothetical protein
MGQILSIPFIILGVYCMLRVSKWKYSSFIRDRNENNENLEKHLCNVRNMKVQIADTWPTPISPPSTTPTKWRFDSKDFTSKTRMDELPSFAAIKSQVFNSIYYKPASSNYWQACFSVNYMWYLRLRLCCRSSFMSWTISESCPFTRSCSSLFKKGSEALSTVSAAFSLSGWPFI